MILKKIVSKVRRILQWAYYKAIYRDRFHMGKKCNWRPGLKLIIENGKIKIGDYCKFNYNCSIMSLGSVEIGDYTLLGEGVKIYDQNHKFNQYNQLITNQGMSVGTVKIGNNCWLGSNVVVLKDTVIGDNCVIGAGCVIKGNIPPNSIVKNNHNYKVEEIKYR